MRRIKIKITKDTVLQDIESIYQIALKDKKWNVALRAKETQGKILGIFRQQGLPHIKRMADMTDEELQEFIARLEKTDPDLKP